MSVSMITGTRGVAADARSVGVTMSMHASSIVSTTNVRTCDSGTRHMARLRAPVLSIPRAGVLRVATEGPPRRP